MKTLFEQYLAEVHAKENPQVLDDDIPDSFEYWLSTLELEDFIKYGNEALDAYAEKL